MPPMRTRPQHVVAGLKDKILARRARPRGPSCPSESELIEEYAVSRTVVREAVSRLRAEGLVETFQGRGSFVLAVPEPSSFTLESSAIRTQHDVLAMVDFRIGVETEAAGAGGAHRHGSRRCGDRGPPRRVHGAPATRARSRPTSPSTARSRPRPATASTSTCSTRSGPMMIMLPRTRLGDAYTMTDATHVERVQREHDNVAAAILAGDVDTARAAMRLHLGNTRRRLTR